MVVCVDRMITSATCFQESSSTVDNFVREREEAESVDFSVVCENGDDKGKGSLRECRICQEEDDEKDMEAPCACNGTLKV